MLTEKQVEDIKNCIQRSIDVYRGYEYGSPDEAYYTCNGLSISMNIIEEVQRRGNSS